MRLNTLLNRMQRRGMILAGAFLVLFLALITFLIIHFFGFARSPQQKLMQNFANNLTKGKVEDVVESFPPDARESIMRKFKSWDPDLLKNYLSSLHVDFVSSDADTEATNSFPVKYSVYKANPYQQKLTKFIDDMLATEVKSDDSNKLSDYVLEQMRLWGLEESSRETLEGRINVQKVGDDYFISPESSFFTSLSESLDAALKQDSSKYLELKLRNIQASKTADQTSSGPSNNTETKQSKGANPSSSSGTSPSQEKSKRPVSTTTNQVDQAPTSQPASSQTPNQAQADTPANSGSGNWQFNRSNESSDLSSNSTDSGAGDISAKSSLTALKPNNSNNAATASDSVISDQTQAVPYSMVPYESANLVKPGGYWYFVPGEDLFGIARYVYAGYENPEFYAYKIIEANGLSVINGQVYIGTGQALYMPIP